MCERSIAYQRRLKGDQGGKNLVKIKTYILKSLWSNFPFHLRLSTADWKTSPFCEIAKLNNDENEVKDGD